jgi:hypothetical protein
MSQEHEQQVVDTPATVDVMPDADGSRSLTTSEEVAERHEPSPRHVEAGRKGAFRRHELIQRGLQYEQEHGLRRGRQRLRQLIQEGKLYEQEHGLRPARKEGRLPRMSRQQALHTFMHALARLVKPSLRPQVERMLQVLDETPTEQRQAG